MCRIEPPKFLFYLATDLRFLNIYNPITNEKITALPDYTFDTYSYFVKQFCHLSIEYAI